MSTYKRWSINGNLPLCDYLIILKINIIYTKVILKVNKIANISPDSQHIWACPTNAKFNSHSDLSSYLPSPSLEVDKQQSRKVAFLPTNATSVRAPAAFKMEHKTPVETIS